MRLAVLFLLLACFSAAAPAAAPQEAPPASPPPSAPPAASAPSTGTTAPATASAQPKITYSQCHVDGSYVALTFDDGPHKENTPRLLDILKKRGVKATFFVVGQCAAEYPSIIQRINAEGHELANHSWSHPQLSKMAEGSVSDQLERTHQAVIQSAGVTPKLMRPPFGAFTPNQQAWANRKWGYKVVLWDVDPLDWKIRNAAHVESEILRQTVPGSIILSHDIHKSTVDAMPATIDALLAKGFKFVTVSELLAMDKPLPPKPKPTPPSTGTPTRAEPASTGGALALPVPVKPTERRRGSTPR